jgi:hypothetical protein
VSRQRHGASSPCPSLPHAPTLGPAVGRCRGPGSPTLMADRPPPPPNAPGNEFTSEALPGALPEAQNNPRLCPYGLYAGGPGPGGLKGACGGRWPGADPHRIRASLAGPPLSVGQAGLTTRGAGRIQVSRQPPTPQCLEVRPRVGRQGAGHGVRGWGVGVGGGTVGGRPSLSQAGLTTRAPALPRRGTPPLSPRRPAGAPSAAAATHAPIVWVWVAGLWVRIGGQHRQCPDDT